MVCDGANGPRPARLDEVHVSFEENGLISDAGLLRAALAGGLETKVLDNESMWLGYRTSTSAGRVDELGASAPRVGPVDAGSVLAGGFVWACP